MKLLVLSLIFVFALSTRNVEGNNCELPPGCETQQFQGGFGSGQAALSVFWLGVYYSVFSARACELPPGC